MGLNKFLNNKKIIYLLITGILLIIIYQAFRIFVIHEQDPRMLLAGTLLKPYLSMAEFLAKNVIKLIVDGATIHNHKIVFTIYPEYFQKHKDLIENWPKYLFNWKWSLFLLIAFWLLQSSQKKKIVYTIFLLFTHFFAVVSGLIMLGGIGPLLVNSESQSLVRPNAIGAIAFFGLFAIWVKNSMHEIQLRLKKVNINLILNRKKINEILVVFFLSILLRNIIVPYIDYSAYTSLLLKATKSIVHLFGFQAEINGPFLTGANGGTLFMAKWCLGFLTMFIFAAMVYLTRRDTKTTWIYILLGLIVLHLLNIARLSLLFIFVQYHDDSKLIMDHHDMYNTVVYLVIFILWIVWFEKYTLIRNSRQRQR